MCKFCKSVTYQCRISAIQILSIVHKYLFHKMQIHSMPVYIYLIQSCFLHMAGGDHSTPLKISNKGFKIVKIH